MFYGDHMFRGTMRVAFVAVAVAVAVATVTLLAGCQGAELPPASPAPVTTSTTPVKHFSSKAEALAAAKHVFERYLTVTDQIAEDGGEGADRVRDFVVLEEYELELASISDLKEKRLRIVGDTGLLKFKAQSVDLASGSVSAYACLDLKASRLLDRFGKDITPKDRPDQYTAITRFVWQGGRLLLGENDVWSGDSIC